MKPTFVRCKMLKEKYPRIPGVIFNCWGVQFLVQPNGDAVAMIEISTAGAGADAGRYQILDTLEMEKPLTSLKLNDFGMDIGNYFGTGDLHSFHLKIMELRSDLFREFTKTRFAKMLPTGLNKQESIAAVLELVKNAKSDIAETALKSDLELPKIEEEKRKAGRPLIKK